MSWEGLAVDIVAEWGERLEAARRAAGLSQAALGRMLGTTQQQVSTWEHGAAEPKLASRLALADALGVEPDYLFRT